METSFLLAFTTGLLGGFGHCVGMCGPVVASYSMAGKDTDRTLLPHLLYSAGRITTYACLGGIAGFFGVALSSTGLAQAQSAVPIVAGVIMLIMGLNVVGSGTSFMESTLARASSFIIKIAAHLRSGKQANIYPLGLLMGFMPCGMSYSIFIGSAALASPAYGFLYALCFGIGTAPALFLLGTIVTVMSIRARLLIYKAGGVTVILMGIIFIVKGVNAYG